MAASNSIGELEVKVTATTQEADNAIDRVAKELESLEKVTQAIEGIDTKNLNQLGNAMKNLAYGMKNMPDSSKFASLAASMSVFNSIDITNIHESSAAIKELGQGIKELSGSGLEKISFNGLEMQMTSPEQQEELEKLGTSAEQAKAKIDKLTASIQDLNKTDTSEKTGGSFAEIEAQADSAEQSAEKVVESEQEVSKAAEEQEKKLKALTQQYSGLNSVVSQVTGSLSGSKSSFDIITSSLSKLGISLSETSIEAIGIASVVGTVVVSAFNLAKRAVESYINGIKKLGNAVKSGVSKLQEFAKIVEKIVDQIKEWGTALGETLGDLSGIPDMADKVSSAFGKLGKEVQKVTHLFTYMGLRKAFTAVYNEMGTAVDHLTQKFETFGTELTALQNELSYLGHSAAAVSVPLLDSLGGALTTIIDLLATAISYINMFISALTGKSTYVAAKKQIGSVDDALSGAAGSAEKVKDYLGDIDELNVINDNPSGGGGGGGVGDLLEDCYEELAIDEAILDLVNQIKEAWETADFSGIGYELGTALTNALNSIPWDEIQETAWKIAHSLATFINGFIEAEGLDEAIGHTIGQALNTALIFANELLNEINFDKIGQLIGNSLNQAVKEFHWDMLGETIALYFGAQLNTIWNAVDAFDWDTLGQSAAVGINSFVSKMREEIEAVPWEDLGNQVSSGVAKLVYGVEWDNLGALVGDYFGAKILTFEGLVESYPYAGTAVKLTTGLNSLIANVPWEDLGNGLGNFFGGCLEFLYNALYNFHWNDLAEGLAGGINSLVSSINERIDGLDWKVTGEKFGEGIKTFMSLVHWDELGDMLGNLVNVFLGFIDGAINSQDEDAYAQDIDDLVTHFTNKVSWEELGESLEGLITKFLSFIEKAINGFEWGDLGEKIGEMLGGIEWGTVAEELIKGIIAGLEAKVDFFGNGFLGFIEKLFPNSLLGHMREKGDEVGGSMIDGIMDGFDKADSVLGSALTQIGGFILEDFKGFFGISSPSTVMAEQGEYIVEGLQEGIENNWDAVPTFLEGAAGELEGILTGTWESIEGSTGDSWSSISSTITGEWESINSQADSSWSSISKTVTDTWSTLDSQSGKDFSSIKSTVNDTWTEVDSETSSAWGTIKSTFSDALDNVKSKVSDGWDNIKSKFSDSFNTVKSDTNSSLSTIQNDFSTSMTSVNNTVDTSWSSIKSGFNTSLATVSSDTSSSLNTIESDFTTFWTDTRTLTTDSWTDIESQTTTAWEMLIAELNTNMEEIREYITTNWTELITELTESWSQINEVTQSASEQMNSTITAGWEQIKNTTTEGVTAVKTAIESENWTGIGQQIVNGIYEGIADGWPKLEKYVRRLAKELYEAACDELEIDSPSKLFAQAGAFVVEGLNEGIEDNEDSTVTAVSDWLGNLGHMSANLDVDFNVSDNLKNYSPNLDTGIDTGSITRAVQESINAQGSVNAMLTGGADFKSVIRDAIDEVFTENKVLDEIAENTREQADKQETTRVYIGNREVARSVRKQNAADGYTFSSSVV